MYLSHWKANFSRVSAKFNLDYTGERSSTVKGNAAHKPQIPLIIYYYPPLVKIWTGWDSFYRWAQTRASNQATTNTETEVWHLKPVSMSLCLSLDKDTARAGIRKLMIQWSFTWKCKRHMELAELLGRQREQKALEGVSLALGASRPGRQLQVKGRA